MRRLAVALFSFALLVAPLAAEAQQPGRPARLGILYGASPAFRPDTDSADRALVAGLRDQGYVVGQNVVIEFRSPQGGGVGSRGSGVDPFPPLAAELVGLGVDVIITTMEPAVNSRDVPRRPRAEPGHCDDDMDRGRPSRRRNRVRPVDPRDARAPAQR